MIMTCVFAGLSGCATQIATTDPINCDTYNRMKFANAHVLDWLIENDNQLARDIISNNERAEKCQT